jgi:hypothetical protein
MTLYEFEINGCWINTGDDGFARNEWPASCNPAPGHAIGAKKFVLIDKA